MKEIIKFDQVAFNYLGKPIFKDVCLSIQDKDYLGIIGPNGSGKTTFLKLLVGLLNPVKGAIKVAGADPKQSRLAIGYVPQTPTIDLDFPIRVRDIIACGLIYKHSFFPWITKTGEKRIQSVLECLSLKDKEHERFTQLSGGQQKKCFIGRALIANPKILILDEPTAGLDPPMEQELLTFFHQLNKDMTILQVSHDLHFVSSHIKRVLCLSDHPEIHDTQALTDHFIQSLYGGNKRLVRHDHIESTHHH